ncbi:MAG: T9SS type A sorting domain-containing protein [Bacteroidetes bacterium]|nr:T9SS type A sorting domain-containing protein [Bacteroidota bacterium]
MKTFILFLILAAHAAAQTLPLPPRPSAAPTGSALYPILAPLSRAAREDTIYRQVMRGNIPDFQRSLVKVATVRTINGTSYTLEYYVTPEYLSLGHDTDYVLMPMTPLLAQKLANALGCTLPTPRMVDQIYSASTLRLAPQPIPPDANMTMMPRFYQHNDSVRALRAPRLGTHPCGTLVGGTKKDVVIDKKVYSWLKSSVPKPVVIYGWQYLTGVPIQPTYNGHEETYADYSHGVRLVQRAARINGAEISLLDIVKDPVMSPLISDTALVKPYYGSLTEANRLPAPVPQRTELLQNFPNPFNPATEIGFHLGADSRTTLKVYDSVGREIATLVDEELQAGAYAVRFDREAAALSSGIYFYRLHTPTYSHTQRMVLLR